MVGLPCLENLPAQPLSQLVKHPLTAPDQFALHHQDVMQHLISQHPQGHVWCCTLTPHRCGDVRLCQIQSNAPTSGALLYARQTNLPTSSWGQRAALPMPFGVLRYKSSEQCIQVLCSVAHDWTVRGCILQMRRHVLVMTRKLVKIQARGSKPKPTVVVLTVS